jgi:hypothetical protein
MLILLSSIFDINTPKNSVLLSAHWGKFGVEFDTISTIELAAINWLLLKYRCPATPEPEIFQTNTLHYNQNSPHRLR